LGPGDQNDEMLVFVYRKNLLFEIVVHRNHDAIPAINDTNIIAFMTPRTAHVSTVCPVVLTEMHDVSRWDNINRRGKRENIKIPVRSISTHYPIVQHRNPGKNSSLQHQPPRTIDRYMLLDAIFVPLGPKPDRIIHHIN
jgi:hypothetical protein